MLATKTLVTCRNPLCRRGASGGPAQFLQEPRPGRKRLYCCENCQKQGTRLARKVITPQRRSKPSNDTEPTIPEDFVTWSFARMFQFFLDNPGIKGGLQNRMFDEWRKFNTPKPEVLEKAAVDPAPSVDWEKAPPNVKEALQVVTDYLAELEASRSRPA